MTEPSARSAALGEQLKSFMAKHCSGDMLSVEEAETMASEGMWPQPEGWGA